MDKYFNVAGPCNPDIHYMLRATDRLPDVMKLIDQQLYFVLHAPRQTGKTTALDTLAQELTAAGRYNAVLVSLEAGATYNDDPDKAELTILNDWLDSTNHYLPPDLQPPPWPDAPAGRRIGAALNAWAESSPRPLVVFLDEIDALQNTTLIAVLRQVRSGYRLRPHGFPWSLALIGMRDVRDYKVASGGSERLNTSSPFNIKARSLTLRNFTAEEVAALYQQHTDATGQVFTPEAAARAFDLTQGQPWLVNDLAYEIVEELVPDRITPITVAHIDQAKEILIQRMDTHLDSLAERLREPRVQRVIEPILAGDTATDMPTDDLRFVLDLGLCRYDHLAGLVIANPIYTEVIPRMLTYSMTRTIPRLTPFWLNADGTMNPAKLLEAFMAFWRRNGGAMLETSTYPEIAPHLVLMAFLHRVINASGTITREFALGKRSMDLCVEYGDVTLAIEVKAWRDTDNKRDPLDEGLVQLDEYLAKLGLDTGWLIIFDQRSKLPRIEERTSASETTTPAGRTVTVIRA